MQQRLIVHGKQMYGPLRDPRSRSVCNAAGAVACADRLARRDRVDEKTAADYALEGGATLHLVLALRGGC